MTKWNEIQSEAVIVKAIKENAAENAKRAKNKVPLRYEFVIGDGQGLMLVVKEKTRKDKQGNVSIVGRTFTWRHQYKRPATGKPNNLTHGTYFLGGGGISIAKAREKAQEARELIAAGIDPAETRNQAREVAAFAAEFEAVAKQREKDGEAPLGTFLAEAQDWIKFKRGDIAERTLDGYAADLENHAYPVIGSMLLGDIRNHHLQAMNEKLMKANSLEMLNSVTNRIISIFERAKEGGRVEMNPISRISKDAKKKRTMLKGHNPSQIEPKQIGEVMKKIREHDTGTYTREACLLAAYTAQRIGSIVTMRREDLNLETGTWTVPPMFMKMNVHLKASPKTKAHIVPLSRQAVEVLREWLARDVQPLSPWVFPNARDPKKHASKSAPGAAMRKMGLKDVQTLHGFRGTFRTGGEYFAGLSGVHMEAQLAHKQSGSVQAKAATANMPGVYLKTEQFLALSTQVDARRKLMQDWADFLDGTVEVEAPEALRLVA